jgi:hypothetical protein
MTPSGYRDKESKSWDQVPRANRSMVGRQAWQQDRGGGGRRLWMHGRHRKELSDLGPGVAATIAGTFSSRGGMVAMEPGPCQ